MICYFNILLCIVLWFFKCRQAKDVIKAIKKRLGSKNTNTQVYAVMVSSFFYAFISTSRFEILFALYLISIITTMESLSFLSF